MLRTDDASISAIGDCASFPSAHAGGTIQRLEAVQNAVDHARCVAERITGSPRPYTAVPWFWTHQYDLKLQVAGSSRDTTPPCCGATPRRVRTPSSASPAPACSAWSL
jgi:3-phenylpropionate/trans-cinnamate dioxygenase ferredoxin reductase subunit